MAFEIESITVTSANPPGADAHLLAPTGGASALGSTVSLDVEGGSITGWAGEIETGQGAVLIRPEAGAVTLTYRFTEPLSAPSYPDAAFTPRQNRYTRPAEALASASKAIAEAAGGGRAGMDALVRETRERFTYDHPERRFNDGLEEVPHLGCGIAKGSCVDINTYLVASLRAAGYEAGYVYGYFFPSEKGGLARDMHCWVATRHEGEVLEWDIAHHIKAGLDPVRPGLNPKPGQRAMIGHSMGHSYVFGGRRIELKLLAEPVWIDGEGRVTSLPQTMIRMKPAQKARLERPAV